MERHFCVFYLAKKKKRNQRKPVKRKKGCLSEIFSVSSELLVTVGTFKICFTKTASVPGDNGHGDPDEGILMAPVNRIFPTRALLFTKTAGIDCLVA